MTKTISVTPEEPKKGSVPACEFRPRETSVVAVYMGLSPRKQGKKANILIFCTKAKSSKICSHFSGFCRTIGGMKMFGATPKRPRHIRFIDYSVPDGITQDILQFIGLAAPGSIGHLI